MSQLVALSLRLVPKNKNSWAPHSIPVIGIKHPVTPVCVDISNIIWCRTLLKILIGKECAGYLKRLNIE